MCLLSFTLALSALAAAPNVALITVDTLRADRLGCYGYAAPATPHLDAFAGKALLFSDCVCEEPQTGPSLCSIFTSLPPRATGVIRNAVPLPDELRTLPQYFKAAGYQTAAVISNWNLRPRLSGLERGFDRYEADFGRGFLGLRKKQERKADAVTALALDCIAKRDPHRPFFFWFHYMDPHGPYDFHNDFNPRGVPLRSLSRIEQVRARYDSEVAYTDYYLGRLIEALPKENTIILFTADHGESLFEHNYLGHTRRVDQTTLHIPLLLAGPGITPGRSAAPISTLDIAPTLLSLAGLTVPKVMCGRRLTQDAIDPARVRIAETYGGNVPKSEDAIAALHGRPPSFQAVIKEGWKLLEEASKPAKLFDLKADPGELNNQAKAASTRVDEYAALLKKLERKTPRRESKAALLQEEDIRALEAAGYL